jgi:Tol biopolymer transport system component
MRLRSTAATLSTAAGLLLAPFASPAAAVTTTSTVLVYAADTDADGYGEIWQRAADGTGDPTKLFSVASRSLLTPTLSPDGTKLAYLQSDASTGPYEYRLYVRNADGTGTPVLLSATDVYGAPNWSADSTKITFSRINWDTFEGGAYIVDATGGPHTLVPTTDDDWASEPSFSPSGRQVAAVRWNDDGVAHIDLITLATGTRAKIAGTEGGEDPQWSPDGKYLLFQKELTCGYGLYRVPAGGGTPTPFRVVANRWQGAAEYSRDGSQVFWTQTTFDCATPKTGELYVANADGTGAALVVSTPFIEYHSSVGGGTPLVDTTAPAAPVINATGTVGGTTASISWTAEQDVTEFVVLRKPAGDPAPTSVTDGTLVYHGAAHSATASGLTTGTVYDFYVFGIDASGNTSPVSAAHPAKPTNVPVVATLPKVGVATAGTTFPVSWASSAGAWDVAVGEKTKNSAGTWSSSPTYKALATGATAKTLDFAGVQGRTHYFKVRAHDGLGNVTAYSSPKAAHVPINENWAGFSYSTGWTSVSSGSRYLGTYRYSTGASKTVSARVDTSSFTIIGDKCSTCGQFKVYVDGVLKGTYDSYSSTSKYRQVLYAGGNFGTVKARTIKIVSVGTAGRSRVDIDGLGLTR